jgi:hypothetical protein
VPPICVKASCAAADRPGIPRTPDFADIECPS